MKFLGKILMNILAPFSKQGKPDWLIEKETMQTRYSGSIKSQVFNRGIPPNAFLSELIEWGRTAPDSIFAPNPNDDIYNKTKGELGPWTGLLHRRAVMLEVMRVLAGFESSWDWTEGVDTSRLGADTPENAEAGAWQVSFNSRRLAPDLTQMLIQADIWNGVKFQQAMKFDHELAMDYVATLMRHNTHHNGPLYRGSERNVIRKSLRGAEHSIYPWLRREAVAQFMDLLDQATH